ncbi:MAG: GGDEF domain-containing protein [Actinomycetales bacterium]|nr:MAG: GGDEF domain-containing protein [Actinomycetales bacterium]
MLLDELTGCYLRAAGFLELEREIIKAERVEQPFTMVFVDVDGLKRINDTQGHEAGDALLRAVVDSVRQVVREYDVVVRYGGDEFLCGMADCDSSEVSVRFERANAALRRADHASVSFGIVERTKGETLASLISRADQAMYDAREERLAQTRPATRDS